jgi:membrane protein implicated in regulation of membrane protease activity
MWWDSMSALEQVLFVLASSSTAIMIIFLVMLLLGFDTDEFDGIGDPDVDFDGINDDPFTGIAGLKILTLRNALVFLAIGSWVAFLLVESLGVWLGIILGLVAGMIAAFLQALAFRATLKLESAGNLDYSNAIGKKGTVYLRIPHSRSGKGKVSILVQERLTEIDAVTDEKEDILPKTSVEVVGLLDSATLIVKSK